MPDLPASQSSQKLTFREQYPILTQVGRDAAQLTWQQMGVPILGTLGGLFATFLNDFWAGRLDFRAGLWNFGCSLVIGIVLYVLVAIVRAPFIVIGRQSRQLYELDQRLTQIQSQPIGVASSSLGDGSRTHDSAEPNIVLHVDGGSIDVHEGAIGVGEGHSVFDIRGIIVRCKNERSTLPPRKVGSVGNVSAEISFSGYGAKALHLPGELCVWLSDSGKHVNFPVGETQRIVVATIQNEKLCVVQRRSPPGGPQVWKTELTPDYGNIFRVRIALYVPSERTPLVQGDFILERDGRATSDLAGPQLTPTQIWRRIKLLQAQNDALRFVLAIENDKLPTDQFDEYQRWEEETATFIQQHYGDLEKTMFLFESGFSGGVRPRFPLPTPSTLKDRLNARVSQIDRLRREKGL